MLVRVEFKNSQGTSLVLPLDDDSSGFFIKEMEGLDPVKATLVSTSFAGEDGAQYHTSHREPRNIKVKMGVDPDWLTTTVESLRKRLYNYFMPKSQVSLRFVMDSGLYVDIVGRVETFDFPLFVKEPEANLSLICFQPDFIDPNPVNFSGMSVADNSELLIDYEGSIETGMVITLRPDRAVTAFTFYHRPPDGTLGILDFTVPLLSGDVLEISTIKGQKSLQLTRGATVSSVLYGMTPQSSWLEFQPGEPGDNHLRLYAVGAPFPFDIEYYTRYGGL